MRGERGRRQVVRRPVGKVARRVDVAHDRRLALGDAGGAPPARRARGSARAGPHSRSGRARCGRRRSSSLRRARAPGRLRAQRVCVVERPRDGAAHVAQRPRRCCRGRAKRVGVSRRREPDAQVVPVATHLARAKTTVGVSAHVGARLPPDLDRHTEARCYRGIGDLVTNFTLRANELRPTCR